MADRVEKCAGASVVELPVTERAARELDEPLCRARRVCGTRFGQEGFLNLWAKDVMFLARALAAQGVRELLDRGVGERAGIEPTLGDPTRPSKDLDASGFAPG